jgi:hypothetical protein
MVAILSHVEVAGNQVDGRNGGGIWSAVSDLVLTADTYIHGNIGASNGAGLYLSSGTATCSGVRFAFNQAIRGSAIYCKIAASFVDNQAGGGLHLLFPDQSIFMESV